MRNSGFVGVRFTVSFQTKEWQDVALLYRMQFSTSNKNPDVQKEIQLQHVVP